MEILHLAALPTSVALLMTPMATDPMPACKPAGPLVEEVATSSVVFVGTVIETGSPAGDPPVMLRVEEVWHGNLPKIVTVHGLSDGFVGDDDRIWRLGARYLVIPRVHGDELWDIVCTATTEWQPELAALRPVGAPSSDTGIAIPLLPLLGVAAFVVVLLAAFLGYDRYGRRPRP